MPNEAHARKSVLTIETGVFLKVFIAVGCVWALVKLAGKIRKIGPDEIDNQILRAFRRPENPAVPLGPKWLPDVARDITALGSGTGLTLISGILVGFLCLNRRFRAAGYLISSLGSGLGLCQFMKDLFVRRRPTVVPHLTHFDPESFPSGHSMGSALVYLTLGGIISRQVKGPIAKLYFLSVAFLIAMLVGLSRLYLGVHYPSDVLAGWAAGSVWSGMCSQIARWLQRQGAVEPPSGSPSLPTETDLSLK
ncbi:MAG: phosphatase PAP2 family protein [Verrucomicrobia bacterium]|nr:phosphatase PAP2 family protein [Verrucomicrobiota bacterium]